MQGKILFRGNGVNIKDADVISSDILSGKTAYNNEGKITGTMVNNGSSIINPSPSTQTLSAGYYENIKVNAQTGLSIDGLIEQYKVEAGENINAGDFVTFLNKASTTIDSNIELCSYKNTQYPLLSAVELSTNKIFIIWGYKDTYDNNFLAAMICTINGASIIKNTIHQLGNYTSGRRMACVKLTETRVAVFAYYVSDTYAHLCTINGTTITNPATLRLDRSSASVDTDDIVAIQLSETQVFLIYSYRSSVSSSELRCLTCTFEGNTITYSPVTTLASGTLVSEHISAVKLMDNKIFIAHSQETNRSLWYLICSVNENLITKITNDTQLSAIDYSGSDVSVVKLSDTKIFIAHGYTSNYYLYGLVCVTNSNATSIKPGIDTQLNSMNKTSFILSTAKLNENKVFITYEDIDDNSYSTVCNIEGTSPIILNTSQLSNISYNNIPIATVKLNNNKVFVVYRYSNDYLVYGLLLNINLSKNCKSISSSEDIIEGIAKTNGTSGQNIDVYIPNI